MNNKEKRSTDALDRLSKESGITLEKGNRKAHGLNIHSLIPTNDALRLAYHGVFYEGGVAVKTDGRALCAIHCEYPRTYEGKVIGESGEEILSKFPKWRSIIPASGYELNLQKFMQAIDGLPKGTRFVRIRGNAYLARRLKQAALFIRKAKDVRLYLYHYIDSRYQFMAVADGGILLIGDYNLWFNEWKSAENIDC